MFVDLRDHYGVTQVVVHDDSMLKGVSKETVIKVTGKVIKRDEETNINPDMYGQLIFNKGGKNIKWEKDNLFSKWCWENWTAT